MAVFTELGPRPWDVGDERGMLNGLLSRPRGPVKGSIRVGRHFAASFHPFSDVSIRLGSRQIRGALLSLFIDYSHRTPVWR